jgi:hypothetical protein
MNATQLLFLIVGIFVIVNAGNFLQVFQGKAKINVTTGSRSTPQATTTSNTTAKGQAGS